MLDILKEIFDTDSIETDASGNRTKLHSHTSLTQGLFLQKVFDDIKPKRTLEIGLAFGISSLFILEMHKNCGHTEKAHTVIEPFPWGGVAEHNIEKVGLSYLVDYKYSKSDEVLPRMYYDSHRIQYAYVDTTKVFDTILSDFYFIDKILDVNGVVIFDDCGGNWPGVQRVVRFVNSLPHYQVYKKIGKVKTTFKRKVAQAAVETMINLVPLKKKYLPGLSFKSDKSLGLDYGCIAFIKTNEDLRNWDYDKIF